MYQIKRKHLENEIIAQKRKLVIFNAHMHTACTYFTMATAKQGFLYITNMIPPIHIQNGPYEIQKLNTLRTQTKDGDYDMRFYEALTFEDILR